MPVPALSVHSLKVVPAARYALAGWRAPLAGRNGIPSPTVWSMMHRARTNPSPGLGRLRPRSLGPIVIVLMLAAGCTGEANDPVASTEVGPSSSTVALPSTTEGAADSTSTLGAPTTSAVSYSLTDQLDLHSTVLDLPYLAAEEACETTAAGDALPGVVAQTYGTGPVYATLGSLDGTVTLDGSSEYNGWYYVKVLWSVTPDYTGPVLVRGRQLDGKHVVLFGPDEPAPSGRQLTALAFPPGSARDDQAARFLASAVLVPAPGCYALQVDALVDGQPFRDVIVFEAIGSSSAVGDKADVPAIATGDRSPDLFLPLGQPGCEPASPTLDWYDGDGPTGLTEVRATSDTLEVWGLLWQAPPLDVELQVKMVWTATGSGDFQIRARNESNAELQPSWGPNLHSDSNLNRPGDEWGTAFTFPSPGCWEIEIGRGTDTARVWVQVTS